MGTFNLRLCKSSCRSSLRRSASSASAASIHARYRLANIFFKKIKNILLVFTEICLVSMNTMKVFENYKVYYRCHVKLRTRTAKLQ